MICDTHDAGDLKKSLIQMVRKESNRIVDIAKFSGNLFFIDLQLKFSTELQLEMIEKYLQSDSLSVDFGRGP